MDDDTSRPTEVFGSMFDETDPNAMLTRIKAIEDMMAEQGRRYDERFEQQEKALALASQVQLALETVGKTSVSAPEPKGEFSRVAERIDEVKQEVALIARGGARATGIFSGVSVAWAVILSVLGIGIAIFGTLLSAAFGLYGVLK